MMLLDATSTAAVYFGEDVYALEFHTVRVVAVDRMEKAIWLVDRAEFRRFMSDA